MADDAVTILRLPRVALLTGLREIVGQFFPAPAASYVAMDAQDYRGVVAAAQDRMNALKFAHMLASDLELEICDLLKTKAVMVQSNLYLRAARPVAEVTQESVGWHRESFYGCPPDAVNFWVPVLNVTPDNSIKYVPGSESIPDDRIATVSEEDPSVQRKSAGHKIGLLYAPKRIVSGVDFSTAKPMVVQPGEVALFPGALIHGAAVNRTEHIRFSVDFRMVARERLGVQKQHYASGREYFVPLEAA